MEIKIGFLEAKIVSILHKLAKFRIGDIVDYNIISAEHLDLPALVGRSAVCGYDINDGNFEIVLILENGHKVQENLVTLKLSRDE